MVILPMLVSCRQELCYDHFPTLEVMFDWETEWERDYGMNHPKSWDAEYYGYNYDDIRPELPEWVNMIRYFEDGSHEEHYLSLEGGKYTVEVGRESSMLLYNGDTEYVVVSDVASLSEARAMATTRTRAGAAMQPLYDAHKGSRTTNPPDVIYSAYIGEVPGIYNHENRFYGVKMQPLVYTYIIMYEFEYGIHNVALARGAIGGMAEAVYLRTGVTSEETSIILFDCDINSHGCIAKVHSFGAPGFPDVYYGRSTTDTRERKYTLNLEVRLRNGKTVDFNYDVTDQMKDQPRGGIIKIKGLRIEDDPDPPSSAFEVEVTDWDDNGEIVDIPIGNQNKKE